ncbi:MAG: hypothetical protein V1752_04015 [Candidatus Firestonebacteria bacterium]
MTNSAKILKMCLFLKIVLGLLLTANCINADVKAWVIGDFAKVNPVTGAVWEANIPSSTKIPADYKLTNPVWYGSGVNSVINLVGAKNEYVAFQVIIETTSPISNVNLTASNLTGSGGTILNTNIEMFKEWYLNVTGSAAPDLGDGWYPDALVPFSLGKNLLGAPFDIPDSFNGITQQANQAVWVDVFIPANTGEGYYNGTITISGTGFSPITLDLNLRVWNFTLPEDDIHVIYELNHYGSIDQKSADIRMKYYQLAQKHRLVMNADDEDNMPSYNAGTETINWTNYDNVYAPFFDGTAFTSSNGYSGPLYGRPIKERHLPFSWDAPRTTKSKYSDSFWPLSYDYKKTNSADFNSKIKKAFQDTEAHFISKGWTRTDLSIFLNSLDEPIPPCYIYNKNSPNCNTSAWCCGTDKSGQPYPVTCSGVINSCGPDCSDGCKDYYDYDHLAFYGQLLKDSGVTKIKFAVDIGNFDAVYQKSDQEITSDWILNKIGNVVSRWVVSSGQNYSQINVAKMQTRISLGDKVLFYNLSGPSAGPLRIDSELLGPTVNPWIAWKYQLNGVETWHCVSGGTAAWTNFNADAERGNATCIYSETATILGLSKDFGQPLPSVRLKAMRRGVQDYEYMYLLNKLGKKQQADSIVNSLVPLALNYMWESNPAQTIGTWSHNPYDLYNARVSLGDLASANTLSEGGDPLANVKVYPNPFRLNKLTGNRLKIINIPAGSIMEIYNNNGELIVTLKESDFGGIIYWNGKNNKEEFVSNGVYYYIVSDTRGNKRKGKIGLIK